MAAYDGEMDIALADSGAAKWLVVGPARGRRRRPPGGSSSAWWVAVSTAAHLVLQIPLGPLLRPGPLKPIAAAVGAGVNPVAASARARRQAAGFCHTLLVLRQARSRLLLRRPSASPLYTARDLLRLSAVLAPLTALLVLFFAAAVLAAMHRASS